ncbi:MAG TPA: hypothetical protein VHD33_03825, partial [Legionellaceae bacterium]|nr:hypothetical protein [Legionellaceae bacterium]
LHADQNVVTFFFALFSIGLALGSLLCVKISKNKHHTYQIYPSLLGITIFTLDIFISSPAHVIRSSNSLVSIQAFLSNWHYYGVIIDFTCIAIFGGLYTVPLYTLLQTKTNPIHRARVIAFNNIMNALFMMISAGAIMLLAGWNSPPSYILLLLALGTGVVTLFLYQHRHEMV